jgi:5'-nucleotidase (lipoprotein e(P4) family)
MEVGMSEGGQALVGRRGALAAIALAAGGAAVLAPRLRPAQPAQGDDRPRNPLLWAVAWKETAAEYRALCYQAFNLARMRLDQALDARMAGQRRLAVVTDVDDTILHVGDYWGQLIASNHDFFDDDIWDDWIPRNLVTAAPGALEFLEYARDRGVEVFYITSRDQGENTFDYALQHLQLLGFPFADADHLTVLRDTSNKEPARQKIAEAFEIALLLGDNLNDFRREYYVTDVDERLRLVDADRDLFGRRFIVLPNPTDGHWVRAIFGDSEPPATDDNRRLLERAATRSFRQRA